MLYESLKQKTVVHHTTFLVKKTNFTQIDQIGFIAFWNQTLANLIKSSYFLFQMCLKNVLAKTVLIIKYRS